MTDISIRGGGGIMGVLAIVGLACIVLAFKMFGYVVAITEALFAAFVLLFYLFLLVNAIKRKDIKFIVISLVIIVIGMIYGSLNPIEIAEVKLRTPYSGMFLSSVLLSIAGMFYITDIPFFTGEKGMDLLMIVMCFLAIFIFVYIFSFILLIASESFDIYTPIKWLAQNEYLDERFANQTKSEYTLLEEFVKSANGDKEKLLDEKALQDYMKEQYYLVEIRDNTATGKIRYLIVNDVNPDVNDEARVFVLNIETLKLEVDY